MTRVRIFRRVDLPEPLAPNNPTDSPGAIWKSTSRSTHRHLSDPSPRRFARIRSNSSRRTGRIRSAWKRFQMCAAAMLPSGNIGDPRLQPFEEAVPNDEDDGRRQSPDGEQAEVWSLPEQD